MRKSDITKQKILKAAMRIFAEKGFHGASVNDIADTAGVNKRMIYAHFENKESLYIAVIDEAFRRLSESESVFVNEKFDCVEAVNRIIEHYFKFFAKNKSFVKLVMHENLNGGRFFKKSSAHFIKIGSVELLKTKLNQGKESGVFKCDLDTEDTAFMIINICFSCFLNTYLLSDILHKNFDAEIEKKCSKTKKMCVNYLLRE